MMSTTETTTIEESASGLRAPEVASAMSEQRPPIPAQIVPVGRRKRYHASLLIAALAVITVAAIFSVQGPEVIRVPALGNLPGVCLLKRTMNIDCPGCGLTRCFVSLAHGDFVAAWHFNPAGLFLFAIVLYQVPYRSFQIWQIHRTDFDRCHGPWFTASIVWLMLILLLGQWGWKMVSLMI